MAKLGGGSGLKIIPLTQIVETGNVRFGYTEIAELAQSIKSMGQLEPVLVKHIEPDENGERYELIAGHRRHMAIKKLHDEGESFNDIQAIVVQGDKLTIQLVENLQRSDLTAAEKERGIWQMCENGLSQKDVAAKLSKSEVYVSRHASAHEVRQAAFDALPKSAHDEINWLLTGTLNEIQAAAASDYAMLVSEIIANGGTSKIARQVMENYRTSRGQAANPRRERMERSGGLSDPLKLHPSPASDSFVKELSENGVDTDVDIHGDSGEPTEPRIQQNDDDDWDGYYDEKSAGNPHSWIDDYVPPPHKQVDFNTVCLTIMKYAKTILDFPNHPDKLEAVHDILRLLHEDL